MKSLRGYVRFCKSKRTNLGNGFLFSPKNEEDFFLKQKMPLEIFLNFIKQKVLRRCKTAPHKHPGGARAGAKLHHSVRTPWLVSSRYILHMIGGEMCGSPPVPRLGIVAPVQLNICSSLQVRGTCCFSALHCTALPCQLVGGSSWVGFFILALFIIFSGYADLPTIAWVWSYHVNTFFCFPLLSFIFFWLPFFCWAFFDSQFPK